MREMINSKIDWVGDIPSNWKVLKNKHCFELVKEIVNGDSGNYQLLSLSTKGIVEKEVSDMKGKIPESFDTYQKVNKGQLVICLFDLDISAVFSDVSKYNGMISPAYKVFNCKSNILNRYAKYWFDLNFVDRKYKAYSKSLRYVVNTDDFAPILILVPPIDEQEKIANYLDEKIADINKIINETEETIEKYKEYRQSIITEVVIGGLNKEVEKRNSGIEWIGDIPSHWKISRIKNILEWKSIKNHPEETVLSLYREYGVIPKDSRTDNHNVTSEDTSSYKLVDVGDFVVNKMKAWQGSMAVSDYRGIISPAYHICSFKKNVNINKKYFHYLLRNKVYTPEFRRLSAGIREGQWDLSFDDFKNIPYLIPPIEEQDKIVEYIDNKYKEIDILIEEKNSLIKQLEEYKKSLIYEYVTGKREIKG